MLWFEIALLLLAAVVLMVAMVYLVIATWMGAPFVPMPWPAVRRIVELSQVKPGQRAIDLGSGDGRLVIELARAGAKAEGYEIQPFLVWWSQLRIRMAGLSGSAKIHRKNLWQVDCSGADVVTLYAFPSMMAKLEQKLQSELSEGAKVLSLSFSFPNWQPVKEEQGVKLYVVHKDPTIQGPKDPKKTPRF